MPPPWRRPPLLREAPWRLGQRLGGGWAGARNLLCGGLSRLAGELSQLARLPRNARQRRSALGALAGLFVLEVVCSWVVCSAWPAPARADSGPSPQAYRCGGDPLTALLVKGPMDDPSIPDPSTAPVPVGGSVVLAWRGISLQLPRTNNAGPASFSDGKWWWSLEDPAHPRFRLRRPLGDIQDFACEPAA